MELVGQAPPYISDSLILDLRDKWGITSEDTAYLCARLKRSTVDLPIFAGATKGRPFFAEGFRRRPDKQHRDYGGQDRRANPTSLKSYTGSALCSDVLRLKKDTAYLRARLCDCSLVVYGMVLTNLPATPSLKFSPSITPASTFFFRFLSGFSI